MEAVLAEKAFEALQVCPEQVTLLTVVAGRPCWHTSMRPALFTGKTAVQAERECTEFRIKAIGKALEYKHLEVQLPAAQITAQCLARCHWHSGASSL